MSKNLKTSMTKPPYKYDKTDTWNVYQMEYIGNSEYGTKISSHATKEEAETETYRLNGWELKTK